MSAGPSQVYDSNEVDLLVEEANGIREKFPGFALDCRIFHAIDEITPPPLKWENGTLCDACTFARISRIEAIDSDEASRLFLLYAQELRCGHEENWQATSNGNLEDLAVENSQINSERDKFEVSHLRWKTESAWAPSVRKILSSGQGGHLSPFDRLNADWLSY